MCDIHYSHCILHWWSCGNVNRNRWWFDYTIFTLLSLVFPLLQVLFLLIGVLIGVIISRVGSTFRFALGVAFGLYVTGLFSNVVNSDIARWFHRSDILTATILWKMHNTKAVT